MHTFSKTKQHSRRGCRIASAKCAILGVVLGITLLVVMMLPRTGKTPHYSAAVTEPTVAQTRHQEDEARVNAALLLSMESAGLAEEAARLRAKPLRFRVMSQETRLNEDLCYMTGTAALVGVHVPIIGHDLRTNYLLRFKTMLDYIAEEQLSEDDIIYVHDSDVIYLGAELVPHVVDFGLYSPPSPEDLDVAAIRAYDDHGEVIGADLLAKMRGTSSAQHTYHAAPVRFARCTSCNAWAAIPRSDCKTSYAYVESLVEAVRNHNDASTMCRDASLSGRPSRYHLTSYYDTQLSRGVNMYDALNNLLAKPGNHTQTTRKQCPDWPFASQQGPEERMRFHPNYQDKLEPGYLNAGVFMARVWAFRQFVDALFQFERTHVTIRTTRAKSPDWWCDQSIIGTLYSLTRLWEAEQGLLYSAPPAKRSPFPANPNGLLPGLLGVETYTKTVLLLDPVLTVLGARWEPAVLRAKKGIRKWKFAKVRHADLDEFYKEYTSQLHYTRAGAYLAPTLLQPDRTELDEIQEKPLEYYLAPERSPVIAHFPGQKKARRRAPVFPGASVSFPTLIDPEAAEVARKILNETLIELHTRQGRVYKRYYDVCAFPQ